MGLEMYAFTTTEQPSQTVDFKTKNAVELYYWRKHPNLHGWMRNLYYEKGGTNDSFNCVSVALTADDLDQLEVDIRAGSLPETCGFFFGMSDGSEMEDDLNFVEKGRTAIAEGLTLYYYSWW